MSAAPPTPFPWDDVLAAGLGVLRLPPSVFWTMTPRELTHALRGLAGLPSGAPFKPLGAAELSALMQQFPDASGGTP